MPQHNIWKHWTLIRANVCHLISYTYYLWRNPLDTCIWSFSDIAILLLLLYHPELQTRSFSCFRALRSAYFQIVSLTHIWINNQTVIFKLFSYSCILILTGYECWLLDNPYFHPLCALPALVGHTSVTYLREYWIYSGGSLAFSFPSKTFPRVIGRRWGRRVGLMHDTTFVTLSVLDLVVSFTVKMVEAEALSR